MNEFVKYASIIRHLRKEVSPSVIRQLYRYAPEFEGIRDFMGLWDRENDSHERKLTLLALIVALKEIDQANKVDIL